MIKSHFLILAQATLLSAAISVAGMSRTARAEVPGQDGKGDRSDCLVGVYYFSGWWHPQPNKWTVGGQDWRKEWPARIPLLGEYNEQETMDREIAAAAEHGVHFFQILWYPAGGQTPQDWAADPLNAGLRQFLAWASYAKESPKPYVPYLPAGWDPRPWKDPRPSFTMPTRNEWRVALRKLKDALDAHQNLGVPRADGRRQKMLLIYAWNEFGEGGIVAPTQGDGYMKLEVIQEILESKRAKP